MHNEEVCQNEIRTFTLGDKKTTFLTKRCKSKRACVDNYRQNWESDFLQNQCRAGQKWSVCRCCCEGNDCNGDAMPPECLDKQAWLEGRFDGVVAFVSKCQPYPSITGNGTVTCSDYNRPNSVCRFSCIPGYGLDEPYDTIECVEVSDFDFYIIKKLIYNQFNTVKNSTRP